MPEALRQVLPNWSKGGFREDFGASIVVFLVALPLCLGIAIACGAPPMLGLISGIIGGLVVGSLGGAPLQVSGPAAGLVALVYETIQRFGLEGLGLAILIAGLLQVGAGWARIGGWFRAVSPAVIQGMLSGIGVLIIASQFHVMLDVSPESTGIANLMTIPETVIKGVLPLDNSSHHLAAMLGLLTVSVILLWKLVPSKVRVVPAALAAVVVAVIVSSVLQLPVKYVEIPGRLFDVLTLPHAGSLALLKEAGLWISAVTIAVVASAETMLSASAVCSSCAALGLNI